MGREIALAQLKATIPSVQAADGFSRKEERHDDRHLD